MAPKIWRTLILTLGAAVIAVTTGTAVMAMVDYDGEQKGGFAQCAADACDVPQLFDGDASCAADACDVPQLFDGDASCAADACDVPQLAPEPAGSETTP